MWISGEVLRTQMNEVLDIISVLSGSRHRLPILQYLDDEPAGVSDISSDLDIPRTTVKHNLTRLEETELIQSVGTSYSVTTFGTYVCEDVTNCLNRIAVSTDLLSFLEVVPRSTLDLDISTFQNSNVTAVSSTNPHAPVERLLELVQDAAYLRVATPVILPRLVDAFHEAVVERGIRLDLIVPAETLEMVQSEFASEYRAAIESERLIVGVSPDDIPFGLFLFEEQLALVGHDGMNLPRCLVESDAETALQWANEAFRDFERRADTYVWYDN